MSNLYPAANPTEPKKVQNILCYRTLDLNGISAIIITWNPGVPDVPVIDGFNVYCSLGGDFSLLVSGVTTSSYMDSTAKLVHGADFSYKVVYISNGVESSLCDATQVDIYSCIPKGLEGRVYWVGMETVRRIQWMLGGVGETVKIFLKKHTGVVCPYCYDTIGGGSIDPRCDVCFGTSFVGGYDKFDGRLIWSPSVESIIEKEYGRMRGMVPKTYLGPYPILHTEDVVVKQDNTRLMVGDVQPFVLQGFMLLQDVNVTTVEKGHPAWNLE